MAAKPLTADDLATYTITLPGQSPECITAAYTTIEGEFVLFKDHEHRTVAMVRNSTVAVIRREGPEVREVREIVR